MAGCKGCGSARSRQTAAQRFAQSQQAQAATRRIPAKQEDGFVTVYDSKGNPISLPI